MNARVPYAALTVRRAEDREAEQRPLEMRLITRLLAYTRPVCRQAQLAAADGRAAIDPASRC